MLGRVLIALLITGLTSPSALLAQAPEGRSLPAAVVAELARRPKPRYAKLDSRLNQLARQLGTRSPRSIAAQAAVSSGDAVGVSVRLARGASIDTVRTFLESRNCRIANVGSDVIEAMVPVGELPALNGQDGIAFVRAITPPLKRVTSQGALAHNAPNWNASGATGEGVRVAVIDGGFAGIQRLIGTELPQPEGVRCYTEPGKFTDRLEDCDGGEVHGTGVAETLLDVAPRVTLYIARPISSLDMHATVDWLIQQRVRVINFSVGPQWEGPGNGTTNQSDGYLVAVDKAIAGNIVWVNAAGNEGLSTWTGGFADEDGNSVMEFAPQIEANAVLLPGGKAFQGLARWDDSWDAASRDLELYLFNESFQVVASSEDDQAGRQGQVPFEAVAFTPPDTGIYYLVVKRASGDAPGWVQVQAATSQPLGIATEGYSIDNPSESRNPGLLAVGSAPWTNTLVIEANSSRGPTIDGRVKPDIVGADRGDTVSYGPGAFLGTSQASPHVAGLAALVRQASPDASPADVAAFLKVSSDDRGSAVPNNTWGFGFASLPTLGDYEISPSSQSFRETGGNGTIAVRARSSAPWAVMSEAPWISVTSGASGQGDGSIGYTVAANSGAARTGIVWAAGQLFTVTQDGAECIYALSTRAFTAGASGGTGSVNVSVASECMWTASSNAPWITVGGGSGRGNGTVNLTTAANDGGARGGAVVIAGLPVTITQEAAAGAPRLRIVAPTSNASYPTSSTQITLSGTVSADINTLQWENSRGDAPAIAASLVQNGAARQWTIVGMVLQPGINVITVRGRTADDRQATAVLAVTLSP